MSSPFCFSRFLFRLLLIELGTFTSIIWTLRVEVDLKWRGMSSAWPPMASQSKLYVEYLSHNFYISRRIERRAPTRNPFKR